MSVIKVIGRNYADIMSISASHPHTMRKEVRGGCQLVQKCLQVLVGSGNTNIEWLEANRSLEDANSGRQIQWEIVEDKNADKRRGEPKLHKEAQKFTNLPKNICVYAQSVTAPSADGRDSPSPDPLKLNVGMYPYILEKGIGKKDIDDDGSESYSLRKLELSLKCFERPDLEEGEIEGRERGVRFPGIGAIFNAYLVAALSSRNGDGLIDGEGLFPYINYALADMHTYRVAALLHTMERWNEHADKLKGSKKKKFEQTTKQTHVYEFLQNAICEVAGEPVTDPSGGYSCRSGCYVSVSAFDRGISKGGSLVYYFSDYDDLVENDFTEYADVKACVYRMSHRGCNTKGYRQLRKELAEDGEIFQRRNNLSLIVKASTLRRLGVNISKYSRTAALRDLKSALELGIKSIVSDFVEAKLKEEEAPNLNLQTGAHHLACMVLDAGTVVIRFDLESVVVLRLAFKASGTEECICETSPYTFVRSSTVAWIEEKSVAWIEGKSKVENFNFKGSELTFELAVGPEVTTEEAETYVAKDTHIATNDPNEKASDG